MPGLKYTITADPAQAVAGFQQVEASARQSSARMAQSFADANKRMENSAQFSARTLKGAIGGLALNASFFLGPQAQAAIYPLMLLQREYRGVSAAMKLVGITAPMAVAGIAGITAAAVTGFEAFKAVEAKLQEIASIKNLGEQDVFTIETLGKQIRELNEAGKLTADEFSKLFHMMEVGSKTPLKEVALFLREIVGNEAQFKAADKIKKLSQETLADTLAGLDRQKFAAGELLAKRMAEIDAEATAAGRQVSAADVLLARKRAQAAFEFSISEIKAKAAEEEKRAQEDKTRAMLEERAFWATKEKAADEFYAKEEEREAAAREHRRQMEIEGVANDFRLTDAQKFSRLNELGASPLGPDPNSRIQQLQAAVVGLQNTWGTVAQNIAAGFTDIIGGAVNSISAGISGLILQTKTWSQALSQIGTSILTGIVNAIVQMGVRWIATQILMATVGKSIMAAGLAANIPIAAAQTALWSAPAVLATIASYGSAAAAAPAFIAASQAISLAGSLAQFAAGGRPPVGRASLVGERGPELFIPDQPGRILSHSDTMSAIRTGGAGARSSQVKNEITFLPIMDPAAAANYQRDHIEAIAVEVFARETRRLRT